MIEETKESVKEELDELADTILKELKFLVPDRPYTALAALLRAYTFLGCQCPKSHRDNVLQYLDDARQGLINTYDKIDKGEYERVN